MRHTRDPALGSYVAQFARAAGPVVISIASARDLSTPVNLHCTLIERLLLELCRGPASTKLLDKKSGTLCAGSRTVIGEYVPLVRWLTNNDKLHIGWASPDSWYEYGVRSVFVL
jgi:hypothetical protein